MGNINSSHFDVVKHLTQGLLWGIASAFAYAVLSLLSHLRKPVSARHGIVRPASLCCTVRVAVHTTVERRARKSGCIFSSHLGVIFTALGQGLVVASLQFLRAQTTSVVFGWEPVYGIILANLLLGEVPTVRTLLGGVLICGVVLWTLFSHRHAKQNA